MQRLTPENATSAKGPLSTTAAQKKFLLVVTNYFSKLVEVEAYASIKDKDVSKFVWKNIVCRFGIPQAKGRWVEELPGVLWAYRTTPERPTGNTPFALVYDIDAIIPTEIGMPTARTVVQGQKKESEELTRHLDWAD
ncbi:hypothetical protein CK203_053209 [Vitis vinifera]|uniref:Uncharacterized protein n=1 Tax=Vitis vinifera TaxID=29760 RepID=A0A438GJU9_VITVI|nr:hypothetical protein CK203_053209 [Vitis vinifera]